MEKTKVVILAGGLGTRLQEETEFRPKPMVPVGNKPILWHIMKGYSHYGFKNFVVCLGYKGEMIKEYFLRYRASQCDFTVYLGDHERIDFHASHPEEDWTITLADTGVNAMTGARLKKIEKYIDTPYFLMTYGDGVSNINVKRLVDFHLSHGKIATASGVKPPSRFGELMIEENRVVQFSEKPQVQQGTINGGFFVLNREVFKYLSEDDHCTWEREPMERLAEDHQLMVYRHEGFWQCMDTLRDTRLLNELWENGNAPWKVWEGDSL